MTSTEGVYIDGDLIHASDASGPRSAEMVLGDPAVQAAVLETARGGIVRRGLGYDRADVAVVTNISNDHLGTDGVDTMDDLVGVKSLVAEADHLPRPARAQRRRLATARGWLSGPPSVDRDPVVRYFSLSPGNQVVTGHLRLGGIAYLLEDGWLVEAEGLAAPLLRPCATSRSPGTGTPGSWSPTYWPRSPPPARSAWGPQDIRGALASFEPQPGQPRPARHLPHRRGPGGARLRTQPGRAVGRRQPSSASIGAGRALRCSPCPATGPTPW